MWHWSAVVITCRFTPDDLAAAYHDEFRLWQKKGVVPPDTEIIIAQDPGPELGSGGATLNAILVAAEQLSLSKGFSVLVADVIRDARILIIHMGRQHRSVPCGSAAFRRLGDCAGWITPTQCHVPLTPLLHAYLTVTWLAERSQRGNGLWVCGADSFLVVDHSVNLQSLVNADSDILLFSIPVDPAYAAEKHGVYRLNNEKTAEEVVYRGSLDQVISCRVSDIDKRVPLVLALAHLKPNVVESLLHLQNKEPLNRCTYLGVDNGALSLQLSFFFDFLAATFSKTTEENFVDGIADSPAYIRKVSAGDDPTDVDAVIAARRLIWQALHEHKSHVLQLPSLYYHYFVDDSQDLATFLNETTQVVRELKGHYVTHRLEENRIKNKDREFVTKTCLDGAHNEPTGQLSFARAAFAQQRYENFRLDLRIVGNVLKNNYHECLLPLFHNCVIDEFTPELLLQLDQIAIDSPSTAIIGRTLSCIADVLGYWAKGHGGLRSGPAQNADWLDGLQLLEAGNIQLGVERMAELRRVWSTRCDRLIRAARHYEAAAQIFIRRTVMDSVKSYIQPMPTGDAAISRKCLPNAQENTSALYVATACARIDVAGGWSDTPPITYENGGAVVDIAIRIDGKKPIGAKCRRVPEPTINIILEQHGIVEKRLTLRTMDDIMCYKRPGSAATLVCAALVCAGIVNPNDENDERSVEQRLIEDWRGGFEIAYWSDLPQGSGLGTSSILAGCIVATIGEAVGIDADVESILNSVLYIEQLMTTGGGWQDQVGGLCPGVKIGRFESDATWTPSSGRPGLTVEHVNMNEDQVRWLNGHLLLIYTGKTRLAKNLLQEVVRSWYARKQDIVNTVMALVQNAEKAKTAFEKGDWSAVAACAREYWEQKKLMVGGRGCEPERVTKVLKILYERDIIDAGWLAGAGGGGFLYLITKQPDCKAVIEKVLKEEKEIGSEMTVHTVAVDMIPFTVESVV